MKIKKIEKMKYSIPCVNLCTESFSNVVADKFGHVCNLLSVVLGNIKDLDELGRVSALSCTMLNHGIDLTSPPNSITAAHNGRYRTIGIGMMGLHDYLAREGMNFKDIDETTLIAECIEYHAIRQSVELAKRDGSFGAYDVSEWKNGNMIRKFSDASTGYFDWDALQTEIDAHGIRNSELTSPAPNCHSLDDEVLTVNGVLTLRQILLNNNIDIDELVSMPPHWIGLKMPVEVPDTQGSTSYVERIWWNGVQDTIDIEFEDGVTYSFTPNHMLLVRIDGVDMWVQAGDITDGMEIVDIRMGGTARKGEIN